MIIYHPCYMVIDILLLYLSLSIYIYPPFFLFDHTYKNTQKNNASALSFTAFIYTKYTYKIPTKTISIYIVTWIR